MSSIVSRRPPLSGSVSQSKDLRWISMRVGTSRTLSRRAKDRRTRRASAVGTVRRLLPARAEKAGGSRQGGPRARGLANLAQQADAPSGAVDTHGPRPGRIRVCGAGAGGGTAATIGRRRDGSEVVALSATGHFGSGGARGHREERQVCVAFASAVLRNAAIRPRGSGSAPPSRACLTFFVPWTHFVRVRAALSLSANSATPAS